MSNNIKYGVIGTGHLGNYHIEQIKRIKNVSFVGCYDLNHSLANKVAKKHNTTAFSSIELLLEKCNAISVTTPASAHFKVALLGLKKDCHLFIEKPITKNIEEAEILINQSRLNQKIIQIGHIERFNPIFKFLLSQNPKPSFIESSRLSPFSLRGLDVNVVLDLMIHDIDLILCLTTSSIKTICANGIKVLSSKTDLANARIEFEDGLIANLVASRISEKKIRKMRVFEQSKYTSIDFNNYSADIYQSTNQQKNQNSSVVFQNKDRAITHHQHVAKPNNALYEELVAFINSIRSKSADVKVSANEAKLALMVALKIEKIINDSK